MDALSFDPEPLSGELLEDKAGGCGCAACRQREWESDADTLVREAEELEDAESEHAGHELEWFLEHPRRGCSARAPTEVESCGSMREEPPDQCHPEMTKKCPALPEVWKSRTIGGVPFYYKPKIASAGGARKQIAADGTPRAVQIVPSAWLAAQRWIHAMNATLGMPIAAVYATGQGRYCRCIRKPAGVCLESKRQDWHKCTGKTISNHGYGDALDIVGVRWVDRKAVGSSLDTTVIHSWEDREQAELLIRINAALRQSFHTVLDYSRADHRDHFHCDMNQGRVRPVFEEGPCERRFLMAVLKRLGYLGAVEPVAWPRARQALTGFAGVVGMAVPRNPDDRLAWRPIVNRLFGCVALGVAGQCAKR